LRAWPILPHRSPGRPAPKVVEGKEKVEERPKVIEVVAEEKTEVEPKAVEAGEPKITEEPLRLEEEEYEEEPEIEVEESEPPVVEVKEETEPIEEPAVEAKEEAEEKLTEEMPITVEPEPAPKGPPIPSALPYRGSLCPAGCPHLTPVHRSA
jgi:hypothetical protein